MNDGVVTNGNIVADSCAKPLKRAVDTGAILHIHLVAYTHKIHIATDNSIEPYAAIIAHDHIAHHRGIRCNETVFAELR